MKRSRLVLVVPLIILALVTAAAGGWALRAILATPDPSVGDGAVTTVAVREGTVGQTFTLNASASWSAATAGRNRASGTVTAVLLRSASTAKSGARLYAVNLRPVVAIAGTTPMFRDLMVGTQGPDVRQLERLLAQKGYLAAVDNRFTSATAAAVKNWQRSMGIKPDGVVRLGDVVFVRSLPARLGLDRAISTGAQLSGGESITTFGEPGFVVRATREQATRMTTGNPVTITSPKGKRWRAVVAQKRATIDDNFEVVLAPINKATSICGSDCAELPTRARTLLVAAIEVVKPTTGLIVPASAVVTDAAGATMVITADGTRTPVTVTITVGGQSVVTGLSVGQLVQAPAR